MVPLCNHHRLCSYRKLALTSCGLMGSSCSMLQTHHTKSSSREDVACTQILRVLKLPLEIHGRAELSLDSRRRSSHREPLFPRPNIGILTSNRSPSVFVYVMSRELRSRSSWMQLSYPKSLVPLDTMILPDFKSTPFSGRRAEVCIVCVRL